jgi:hypothetical protein
MLKKNSQFSIIMITFSDKLPHPLPRFMNDVVARSQNAVDADMLILSSLTAISACLPNIEGKYARRRVYPNLFLMLAAPPSAGKGRIMLARRIVDPVHQFMRQIYLTKIHQLEEENKDKKQKPDLSAVPQTMLFIPANSSATATTTKIAKSTLTASKSRNALATLPTATSVWTPSR